MRQIFLDSSVVIAYLTPGDAHHGDVVSLVDFIKNKYIDQYALVNVFVINDVVVLEAISKLIHQGHPYSRAKKMIDKFVKSYDLLVIDRKDEIFLDTIYKYYSNFSGNKIRKLQGNDFIIAADADKINALIATCDGDFIKLNLPNVYFISSKSKRYKDQFNKLLNKFFDSM